MAENSAISWTDHTFNPWIGCQKVGPGCDRCYAEAWARRYGQKELWAGTRRRTSAATWRKPLAWNRAAQVDGTRPYVFAASLADIFDNQVPPEWRVDFWDLVRATPCLRWLIVTKRIGNAAAMLPPDWGAGWPHVMLLATVCNQAEADRDVPKLLETPARWHGVSIEPLLGPINLTAAGALDRVLVGVLSWVIVGGESGCGARPADPAWALELLQWADEYCGCFHFKQWGGATSQTGGRLLDGRVWDDRPLMTSMRRGGDDEIPF